MDQTTISTPIGKIGIYTLDNYLLNIKYLNDSELMIKLKSIITKKTIEQVLCYFTNPEFSFEIPFSLNITPFQE